VKRECVVWDPFFVPPQEFKEFVESFGYRIVAFRFVDDVNFDPRVVQYVKEHSNWHAWDKCKYAMRGAPSSDFKIGFAGAAFVVVVDTDIPWTLGYHNGGVPYVKYIIPYVSKYGQYEAHTVTETADEPI
jgi:hypothetical protein